AASPTVVTLALVGADSNAAAAGRNQLDNKTNYFIGDDPSHWYTDIPNYAQVQYQNVYPGVDLVYYGNSQNQLETDYTLAPGVDPSVIRLGVQGAQSLQLDAHGNLVITAGQSTLTEQAPVLYQDINGVRQPVSGGYVLLGDNQVGFQVGPYDS